MMNVIKHIRIIGFFFCLLFVTESLEATHVAGGNLTYKCLGNSRYEVTLEFRRDCFNGATDAQFDDPAAIAIFDQNGFLVEILGQGGMLFIPFAADDTLNETVTSECNVIGGDVCTQTTTYRDIVILPFRNGGYFLAYQRCCRNATLNNIVDPLNTGATYWIRITETALQTCNSSPTFDDWPISFICIEDTLRYSHTATDIDEDSLVYELCAPSTGATRQFPKPIPPASPPYGTVQYNFGFSSNRPLGNTVPMDINSQTGEITAVPDKVGQFLVGVCVREFRNGELLSEVRRDFEYNVRVCGRAPVVMFETVPPNITKKCDGLDIEFSNSTTSNFLDPDSLDYTWFFDWPNTTFTSTEMSPSFTYPASGLYTIALVGDDGTCQDTFFYELGIAEPNDPLVDFGIESSNCEGSVEIYLHDMTFSFQDILERLWIIEGDNFIDTLYGTNPTMEIFFDQEISVTLQVFTESGCNGTRTEVYDIMTPVFNNTFEDQIICDNQLTTIFTNNNIGANVTIDPNTNITQIGNDYVLSNFTGEQDFTITVSDTFCFEEGVVNIQTFPEPILNLENIVQCGTDTVQLNPNGSPNFFYVWSSPNGITFDENIANPIISLSQSNQYYVTVFTSEGSNCVSEDSIMVSVIEYPEFDFFPSANIVTCQDSSLTITVNTTDDVVWTNEGGIQLGTGPELVINQLNQNAVLTATVTNSSGCVTSKEVRVNISSEPDFSFTTDSDMIVCIGDDATLEIISNDSIVWEDINGQVLEIGNTITLTNVTEAITLNVTAYNMFNCPGSQQVTVQNYPDPEYTLMDSTQLDVCFGYSTLVQASSTDSIYWTDINGNILSMENNITIEDIEEFPQVVINVVNEFECMISDTLSFTTLELPMLDTTELDNIVVCRGSDNTISIESQDSVTWMTLDEMILAIGNSLELINVQDDTVYQVQFITPEGCELRDTFDVIVQSDINVSILNDRESVFYCEGDEVTLSASSDSEVTYEWFENGTSLGNGDTFSFFPTGNTQIAVVATDSLGCTDDDTIDLFVSIVSGQLTAPSSMCLTDSITLEFLSDDPDAVVDIIWSPDSLIIGEGFIVTSSPIFDTEFTVLVIDSVGCEVEYSTSLTVGGFFENELTATADPDEILLSESSQLNVDFDPTFEYEWSPSESLDNPNASDPIATPDMTTTYTVVVTDEFGCTGSAEVTVNVIQPNCDESDIFVPNMFTPNGDNLNDVFRVESNFIESMNLIVYNRWGQEIFTSNDQNNTWDGSFEGNMLEPDVFGFHLEIVCINGFEYQTQGNITIMK